MRILPICALAAAFLAAATPALAMSDAECTETFSKADTNNDGVVTEAESPRYFAALRAQDKDDATTEMSSDAFMEHCTGDVFDVAEAEQGAPFEGANSFTEGQAKDRVVAAGYTDVSALAKDDKGIWRGSAKTEGKTVDVVVDYKGNVIAQ